MYPTQLRLPTSNSHGTINQYWYQASATMDDIYGEKKERTKVSNLSTRVTHVTCMSFK